eukprot:TRINITY_DN17596_c0_g1_i1.p1 TRINITY_DN17596_c0_g1~~TRINITY_DN17596_c0_g1_i1.p1  ORF type:complete len:534 (+),score=124.60 TRINITY_DN17596_c0_g1_i1:78-1679(+)
MQATAGGPGGGGGSASQCHRGTDSPAKREPLTGAARVVSRQPSGGLAGTGTGGKKSRPNTTPAALGQAVTSPVSEGSDTRPRTQAAPAAAAASPSPSSTPPSAPLRRVHRDAGGENLLCVVPNEEGGLRLPYHSGPHSPGGEVSDEDLGVPSPARPGLSPHSVRSSEPSGEPSEDGDGRGGGAGLRGAEMSLGAGGPRGLRIRTGSRTLIGKGSFASVFRGLNEETNEIVAVKEVVLVGDQGSVRRQVAQISREIALMQRLSHENIVRYLGACREGPHLLIYLEYVSGGSIAQLVREYGTPGITEDMAKRYTEQVVRGLCYLHDNRIAHRDVKGDNLLVTTEGVVKLADFGASKELRTLAASVTGTACFMAPEVIKGTGHSFESDVWSLGCCAIEMISGRAPFSRFENQYATMMFIASATEATVLGEIPEGCSPTLTDFIAQCMRPDWSARPKMGALQHHRWIAHPQGPPPPSGAPAQPPILTEGRSGAADEPSAPSPQPAAEAMPLPAPPGGVSDAQQTLGSFNPMSSYAEH